MTAIDKTLQQHAMINFMGAILQNPVVMNTLKATDMDGTPVPIEDSVRAMASNMAAAALRDTTTNDLFQFPSGSGVGDALKLFLAVQETDAGPAFEDTLQEGELAYDAAALINDQPSAWVGLAPDGERVDFPGSGDEDGEGRINDLIRAVAMLLGEIGRLERKLQAEQAYADGASERGEAVLPVGADLH